MVSNTTVKNVLLVVVGFLLATVLSLALGFSYVIRFNYQDTQKINNIVAERTQSLCAFFGPLAPVPPTVNSTKVGVQLLEGSRIVVKGLNCPGSFPPPSQELINLGKKYNIPIK